MIEFYTQDVKTLPPSPAPSPATGKQCSGDEYFADYPSRAWDKVKMLPVTDQMEDAEIVEEHKVLHIDKEIYQQLADKLKEAIGGREYISNEQIDLECDCMTYTLNISTYVRYEYHLAPDGNWSEISGLIPVWVELHSYEGVEMDERLNDFSIEKFKKYI